MWNEPDCCPHGFWTGSRDDYFRLFRETANAFARVSPAFRLGGPVTSSGEWLDEFIGFCENTSTPLAFVNGPLSS